MPEGIIARPARTDGHDRRGEDMRATAESSSSFARANFSFRLRYRSYLERAGGNNESSAIDNTR